MIRTAILFGLWAAICMALAIAGFFSVIGEPWRKDDTSLNLIAFFGVFSPVAGIVAGARGALLHRYVPQPPWWTYGGLAIAVILVSHLLVFGGLNIGWWWPDLLGLATIVGLTFMFHAWLSLPVALIGTTLFVAWNRRRAAKPAS